MPFEQVRYRMNEERPWTISERYVPDKIEIEQEDIDKMVPYLQRVKEYIEIEISQQVAQDGDSANSATTTNPPAPAPVTAHHILNEFISLMEFLIPRITITHLEHLVRKANAAIYSAIHIKIREQTLQNYPATGHLHAYDKVRRCTRCEIQLCKECEACLLECCWSHPNPAEIKKNNLESRDTLSARRIWGHCGNGGCPAWEGENAPLGTIRSKGVACRCSEFLSKPKHDCANGEFHFCRLCLIESVLPELEHGNTETLRGVELKLDGDEKDVEIYTCPCRQRARACGGFLCKICNGIASPYSLHKHSWMQSPRNYVNDDMSWMFRAHDHRPSLREDGAEDNLLRIDWEKFDCPWYLSPQPWNTLEEVGKEISRDMDYKTFLGLLSKYGSDLTPAGKRTLNIAERCEGPVSQGTKWTS